MDIQTLGKFTIEGKGKKLPSNIELLMVYIAHKKVVERKELAQYFFSHVDDSLASLRRNLYNIKKTYGEIIQYNEDVVENISISVDSLLLDVTLEKLEASQEIQDLEEACHLYQGHFLIDVEETLRKKFAQQQSFIVDWILDTRHKLFKRYWSNFFNILSKHLGEMQPYLEQSLRPFDLSDFEIANDSETKAMLRKLQAVFILLNHPKQHELLEELSYLKGELPSSIEDARSCLGIGATNNLPPDNKMFTGRISILKDLERELQHTSIACTYVLSGLGGVGKTQIAIQYAHKYKEKHLLIWMVNAETSSTIEQSFAALASQLKISFYDQPLHEKVKAALEYLRNNRGWLLIFDNVEHPRDIRDYLVDGGQHLITSRYIDWIELAQVFPIDVFLEHEATTFLFNRLKSVHVEEAKELAEELGYLPLALAQAASYIVKARLDVPEYLFEFREMRQQLWNAEDATLHYNKNPEQGTIATTWNLTLAYLKESQLEIEDFLNICAFMAADNIPVQLFYKNVESLPETLQTVFSDKKTGDTLLKKLHDYSLISLDNTKAVFSIHRLVQMVIRDSVVYSPLLLVTELLRDSFCFDESTPFNTWNTFTLLVNHGEQVLKYWKNVATVPLAAGVLARVLGDFYMHHIGDINKAKSHYLYALAITERYQTERSIAYIDSVQSYATWLFKMGKHEEANKKFEQMLTLVASVLGKENQWYLYAMTAKASFTRIALRDDSLAADMYQNIISVGEKLDIFHEFPFRYIDNLEGYAGALGELQRYQEAETLYQKALQVYEKNFDTTEHPRYAQILIGLAELLRKIPHLEQAEVYYKQAINIRAKTVGENHPDNAAYLINLGNWFIDSENYQQAKVYFKQAEQLICNVIGEKHWWSVPTLEGLGMACSNLQEHEVALHYYERCADISLEIFSGKHKTTVQSYIGLANACCKAKQYSKAERIFKKWLPISDEVLGVKDPYHAQHILYYANFLRAVERYSLAEKQYQEALFIADSYFQSAHIFPTQIKRHLAKMLIANDDFLKGKMMYEQVLDDFEHVQAKDSYKQEVLQEYKALL